MSELIRPPHDESGDIIEPGITPEMAEGDGFNWPQTTIPRRKFLQLAGVGIAYKGLKKLNDGVCYNPYPIREEPINLPPDIVHEFEQNQESHPISMVEGNNRLYLQADEDFFRENTHAKAAHRAGNRMTTVREARERGIQVFDLDANSVGGKVYAEHGLVPSVGVGKFNISLPFVFDRDELKFKLGRPKWTFKEIVENIGQMSTPDMPLAVAIELKRGKFSEKTLNQMRTILEENNVAAIIKPKNKRELKRLISVFSIHPTDSISIEYEEKAA